MTGEGEHEGASLIRTGEEADGQAERAAKRRRRVQEGSLLKTTIVGVHASLSKSIKVLQLPGTQRRVKECEDHRFGGFYFPSVNEEELCMTDKLFQVARVSSCQISVHLIAPGAIWEYPSIAK